MNGSAWTHQPRPGAAAGDRLPSQRNATVTSLLPSDVEMGCGPPITGTAGKPYPLGSTEGSSSPGKPCSGCPPHAKLLDAASSGGSTHEAQRESGVGPTHSSPCVGWRWLGARWRGDTQGQQGGGGPLPRGAVVPAPAAQQLPSAPAMVRSRVEPKTFFAAERTFLAWLNLAVLVMFASLSLVSSVSSYRQQTTAAGGTAGATKGCGGDSMCKASMIAGMALAPVSMCLMVYALVMYRMRSMRVLRREMVRYDDQRGPVVLTLLLITVVAVAYTLQLHSTL